MSPLVIAKGTTLATAASIVWGREPVAVAANPTIVVEPNDLFRGVELTLSVGTHTVEVTLSGADRLALVELLLGRHITESEARALDGNR